MREVSKLVEKSLKTYSEWSDNDKKIVRPEIDNTWEDCCKKYYNLCLNDKELNSIRTEIENIENIKNFNIERYFRKLDYINNPHDPEFSERVYCFDRKRYEETENLYKNWESEKKSIDEKIEKLKKGKTNFSKKRVQKLLEEKEEKEEVVKKFKELKEKEEQKQYFLKNEKKILEPLKKRYNEILTSYAVSVVEQSLEKKPFMACIEHEELTFDKSQQYNMSIIKNVCNEIYYEAKKSLLLEKDENQEEMQGLEN